MAKKPTAKSLTARVAELGNEKLSEELRRKDREYENALNHLYAEIIKLQKAARRREVIIKELRDQGYDLTKSKS